MNKSIDNVIPFLGLNTKKEIKNIIDLMYDETYGFVISDDLFDKRDINWIIENSIDYWAKRNESIMISLDNRLENINDISHDNLYDNQFDNIDKLILENALDIINNFHLIDIVLTFIIMKLDEKANE